MLESIMAALPSAASLSGAGSFLSGASSLLGGLFGGGGLSPRKAAALEYEYSMRGAEHLARNQLQWKVDDAKKAGIHPLYAIGAPSISIPSVSVGASDNNMGARLEQMGQGVARAANAIASSKERILASQQARLNEATIEGQELENAKKASELAIINQAGTPPPFNLGVPNVGAVQVNPSEITSHRSGVPSLEAAGPAPATKQFVNADGSVTLWPSNEAKQSIEDSWYEYEHMLRNRILPGIAARNAATMDIVRRVSGVPSRTRARYSYGKVGY